MANIQVESLLNDSELQLVKDGMRRYTEQQHAWGDYRPLTVTLRDEQKTLLGAALGEGGRGWLKISVIWVQEKHRGKGYGTQLLKGIEAEAVQAFIFVNLPPLLINHSLRKHTCASFF